MGPRERLLTTLRGGTADRVPLILEGFHYADRDEVTEPAKRALLDRIFDQTHFFLGVNAQGNRLLMTPPQRLRRTRREESPTKVVDVVEIDTPRGPLTHVTGWVAGTSTSWTLKYACASRDDIEKIRSIPWELPTGLTPPGQPPRPADFARRGIVRTSVSSPMVCVAGMMPFELFLELCATDLPLIKELTQQCLDRILSVLDVVLARGDIEYLWLGGCEWLTPPMGSPRLYAELVQPAEQQIIARAHAAGALAHVHCHGRVRQSLPLVIARGADFLEPMEPPPDGDITMADAKALAAGRLTLGGGVEARVLENEDVAAVERAVRAVFAGGSHRLVLQTSAGPLAAMTPRMVANYHRLVDLWEELSPIPA